MSLKKDPILVTGLPRSGTSLTGGCLHACGAWVGNTVEGLYENKAIREKVVKAFLRDKSFDPLGVAPVPRLTIKEFPGLRKKILKIIKQEGYKEEGEWLYKCAKMLLMWKAWKKEFPNAKWVIVRRKPEGIINSCLHTSFMAQHSPSPFFWRQWVDFHLQKVEEIKNDLDYIEIWPQKIINGDFAEIKGAAEQLGLEWNLKDAEAVVKPKKWRFS